MEVVKEYQQRILHPRTEIHYAIIRKIDPLKFPQEHDFYELLLVLNGYIDVQINQKKIRLSKGTLLLIRPGEVHEKTFYADSVQANFAFSSHIFEQLLYYLGKGFDPSLFLSPAKIPMVLLEKHQKNELFQRLEQLSLLPSDNYEIIKTNLKILLFDIFTKYFNIYKTPHQDSIPLWLSSSLEKMNDKPLFVEGLPVLLRLTGKTHEYLCRHTKKYYGLTPTKYINNIRLNYAANLLVSTDLKVIDICYESGFNNLSYFYTVFKDVYTYSPKQYREKLQLQIKGVIKG